MFQQCKRTVTISRARYQCLAVEATGSSTFLIPQYILRDRYLIIDSPSRRFAVFLLGDLCETHTSCNSLMFAQCTVAIVPGVLLHYWNIILMSKCDDPISRTRSVTRNRYKNGWLRIHKPRPRLSNEIFLSRCFFFLPHHHAKNVRR